MKEYALSRSKDVKVPRTIWAGTDLEAIKNIPSSDFESGWVLKPNHGCGHVVIGRGNPQIQNRDINKWWATYGAIGTSGWGGWAYSQARKAVFFEELIGNAERDLIDYKFYIFNGKFALLQLITGRGGVKRRYLLDSDWKLLYSAEDPDGSFLPGKPQKLLDLIRVAEDIGAEFDFMRVDLYFVDDVIWFSELTPYPSTTRDSRPAEVDRMLGKMWELPKIF